MSFTRRALRIAAWALAACAAISHAAEEKKPAPTNQPPTITMSLPFAVGPGTNRIIVRGLNITNSTAVRFVNSNETATAQIVSGSKASLPDKADPKKLGDVQVELLLTIVDSTARELPFVLSTPNGDSNTNTLRVFAGALVDEKEPNGSLKKPQLIRDAKFIRGTIDPANDVDVFAFHAKAGQQIQVATFSMQYGSTLDPILTLYDAHGHILATSDDAAGKDGLLTFTTKAEGELHVGITDAHDRGGVGNTYLLRVGAE